MIRGARAASASRRAPADGGARAAAPTFLSLRGGLHRLPDALRAVLGGGAVRTGAPVEAIGRDDGGYVVRAGGSDIDADAVIVTTPATAGAALLRDVAPRAAATLASLRSTSSAVVVLVYSEGTDAALPASSGFVADPGLLPISAATLVSKKWPDPAYGTRAVVRAFVPDGALLAAGDDELVTAATAALARAYPLPAAASATAVVRWPDATPQYDVGHLDRVAAIDAALPPGIAVAGAALRGWGWPTASGRGPTRPTGSRLSWPAREDRHLERELDPPAPAAPARDARPARARRRVPPGDEGRGRGVPDDGDRGRRLRGRRRSASAHTTASRSSPARACRTSASASTAIPLPEQSRVVAATAGDLRVICVYVINGKEVGDPAYETKLRWLDALREWVAATNDPDRPLVICGDWNVAPDDRDVWDAELWRGKNLASEPERERIEAFMAWGLTDLGRRAAGDVQGPFSYWDYTAGAFHKGWGLRIDLALGTAPVAGRLASVMVERDERKPTFGEGKPSDHAPVIVTLEG